MTTPSAVSDSQPLRPWMRWLLRFAGGYNLLVALNMILFYHEGFKVLHLPRPEPIWPLQLSGLLIGLFGVGYLIVAAAPVENRKLLWLGLASKLLGPVLLIYHIARGNLPVAFLGMLLFSDLVYLPPFFLIARRLDAWARQKS